MLLQLLLGGVAGVAVSIKLFGRRIWRAMLFWRNDEPDAGDPAGEPALEPEREQPPA